MSDPDFNSPDLRQDLLAERLLQGTALSAARVAEELNVSLDTIRRDFIALEQSGRAERVRGGLRPVSQPVASMAERSRAVDPAIPALAARAAQLLATIDSLLIDGGTTALAVAQALPPRPGRLVVTPAPRVALACQAHGAEVILLGGTLSAQGGIATGGATLAALQDLAVNVAVLGACGLDDAFGLSADDAGEAQVKTAMACAADRSLVVTTKDKLGLRARHRVLPPAQIGAVITNGPGCDALAAAGTDLYIL